jgi:DNA-binding NarL/FixJ family response regulator
MSTAGIAQAAPERPEPSTPTAVAVVGDDLAACAGAVALLDAAGVEALIGADVTGRPATVVVFLAAGRSQDRVRAAQTLVETHPDAAVVVAMADDAPNAQLRRALQAGVAGIVLDGELKRTLVATVEAVAAGQLTVPRALGVQIAPRALSYREKQILGLVAVGCTNREIAGQLYIAESTVKTHLSSAFGKLDATSRAEATAKLLDPESPYRLGIPGLESGDAAATAAVDA